MSELIRPSRVQPSALLLPGEPVLGRVTRERILLGYPGFDPVKPRLDVLVFDDSWSLASPGGNDPVAQRYEEAATAVHSVAKWSFTGRQKLSVFHFDHPQGFLGPTPLHHRSGVGRILQAMHPLENAPGSSEALPSLYPAVQLADAYPGQTSLTIFSDWLLLDDDPAEVLRLLGGFPGPVHTVVLNTVPPAELETLPNLRVTRVSSNDPPGRLAAAVAHSLTAARRGRGRPALRHVKTPATPAHPPTRRN